MNILKSLVNVRWGLWARRFLSATFFMLRRILRRGMIFGAAVGVLGIILVAFHYASWSPPTGATGRKPELYWGAYQGTIGLAFLLIGGITSVLTVATELLGKHADDFRHLQKERMRLLRGFTDSWLTQLVFGRVAIYGQVMEMLKKFDDLAHKDDSSEYRLMLLMCIPTLDSGSGDNPDDWGKEFAHLIEQIETRRNVKLELCHLADDSASGISHLRDFIEVLAFKVAGGDSARFQKLFDVISLRSKEFLDRCKTATAKNRVTIHSPLSSIPFQMFCAAGRDFKGVVISFAGKEILEREDREEPVKPVGIFSTDPYVVEEFMQVYREYVTDTGRLPLTPLHTEGIIQRHSVGTTKVPHTVKDFMNLKFPLAVADGGYSPAIGNSAKFTARVLALEAASFYGTTRLPSQPFTILEIGAGSGVLSFVAVQALENASLSYWKAVLTESNDEALKVLSQNAAASNHGAKITVTKGTLKANPSASVSELDCVTALTEKFDLMIADLPFVDAVSDDGRFYDHRHELHAAAFRSGANHLLKQGGKLITAFSSLGGASDITRFEKLISASGLSITHKTSFVEGGYLWIVYVLMRTSDMNTTGDKDEYWWKQLNARELATSSPAIAQTP